MKVWTPLATLLRFSSRRVYREFTLFLQHRNPISLIYNDLQYELYVLKSALAALANHILERARWWQLGHSPILQLRVLCACTDARCRYRLSVFIVGTDIQIRTSMKSLMLVASRIGHFAYWYRETGQGTPCAEKICVGPYIKRDERRECYGTRARPLSAVDC